MSEPFQFTKSKVDDHTVRVGVDVRPVIEPKLDRVKLHEVGNKLVEEYPNLYESLVQSPTEFRITKKFLFPGKGEAELPTLVITQRGPVFVFPRKIAVLQDEVDLNNINDVVVNCLRIFREQFPERAFIRVGLINEYVYDTGPVDSVRLISERFTRIVVPDNGEIRLRINKPTDDYNRIVELQALRKLERVPEISDRFQTQGFGVSVHVDFNNRDTSSPVTDDKILRVLYDGQQYNEKELYQFLNLE